MFSGICFLFHGINEDKGENTDHIIDTIKEEIDIEILPNDLDRLHLLETLKPGRKKDQQ